MLKCLLKFKMKIKNHTNQYSLKQKNEQFLKNKKHEFLIADHVARFKIKK